MERSRHLVRWPLCFRVVDVIFLCHFQVRLTFHDFLLSTEINIEDIKFSSEIINVELTGTTLWDFRKFSRISYLDLYRIYISNKKLKLIIMYLLLKFIEIYIKFLKFQFVEKLSALFKKLWPILWITASYSTHFFFLNVCSILILIFTWLSLKFKFNFMYFYLKKVANKFPRDYCWKLRFAG